MTTIELYRQAHRIKPVRFEHALVDGWLCEHDAITVWPTKGGGWRHDLTEIKAAAERGPA